MRGKYVKRDISSVTEQYLCCTCGACFVSCAEDAIHFIETPGGYLFPQIDRDKCTNCGLCYQVCPGVALGKTMRAQLPKDPFIGNILFCEVGQATNEKVFANSQSGGVVTALLQTLFSTGKIEVAIVATMRVGVPPRGGVLVVRNGSELIQAQKSKYTPIPLLLALREVGEIKGTIALVGLPCHMHGLYNLQDAFSALSKLDILKIGLICDRIMLSTAIDFMVSKATTKTVENFTFRDKQHNNYPGNPVVYETGGNKIVLQASLRMAIKDYFTSARCRLCFDKLNIFADIVCGDPHGVEGVDRQDGETLVLCRTQRGENILKLLKRESGVKLRAVSLEDAINGQGIDKKRLDWSAYMSAWESMGRNLPSYPFKYQAQTDVTKNKQWLEHALHIDKYDLSKDLMKAADSWLTKKRIRRLLLLPLRALRVVILKLEKRGCNDH